MAPVVVIGGGVAGLGTALGLSRAGHRVVVLDRDELTVPRGPDDAFAIERRGAPQVRHTHGLLARLTITLRDRFPDVLESLVAAGGVEVDLAHRFGDRREGDAELRVLLARRTTLEWALRRAAAEEPGVTLRGGEVVDSLIAGDGGVVGGVVGGAHVGGVHVGGVHVGGVHVGGVRLASGEVLEASTVVAAGGRGRVPIPGWLADLGVAVPEEEHDTGIVYLTRWYRTAADWDPVIDGEELVKLGGDLGYLFYLAVPADRGTFSLTMAIGAGDSRLRAHLLDADAFDRAARALPLPAGLVTRLVPAGPVHPMGGLVNRIRRFVDEAGGPIVTGFHAAGDAHTCTNPIYGRGCSLALVQAVALTDAMAAHPDDPVARAVAYEAACREHIEPWYRVSVETDRARQARYHRDGEGGGSGGGGTGAGGGAEAGGGGPIEDLMQLGGDDPIVGRAILRAVNLLATPKQLMADPAVLTRVMELAAARAATGADGAAPTEPVNRWARQGPSRQEMLDLTAA